MTQDASQDPGKSEADTPAAPKTPPPAPSIRLQRYLAQCGLGARRECEVLITSGRITIDGKAVKELGTKVDPKQNDIRLDGERLKTQQRQTFLFNKPPGVLCTAKDPKGRPRVIDFFPESGPRLFTVGRLDENSTGLLIVTNDGDLAQKLAHPKYRIYRTYHIHVKGIPGRDALTAVKQGLWFEEGKFRVQSAKILKRQGKSSILEVMLREGQNREVRRLFDRAGHKVMKLKRVAFGPIRLGSLSMGKFRPISKDEMGAIRVILERNTNPGSEDGSEDGPKRARRKKSGKRPGRPQSRPAAEAPARTRGEERHPASGRPATGKTSSGRSSSGRPATGRPSTGKSTSRTTGGKPASGRPSTGRPTTGRGKAQDRVQSKERRHRSNDDSSSAEGQTSRPRRPGKPRRPGPPRRPGKGGRG